MAEAGKPGTVTIATNMAGRGTDIVYTGIKGLQVVWPLSEPKDTNPGVDRQLRGRSGRQGDPVHFQILCFTGRQPDAIVHA